MISSSVVSFLCNSTNTVAFHHMKSVFYTASPLRCLHPLPSTAQAGWHHSSWRGWALLVLGVIVMSGCGTMRNGRGWGQEAIYPVSWERVQTGAYNAFFDYQALIPAAGALIFTINVLQTFFPAR